MSDKKREKQEKDAVDGIVKIVQDATRMALTVEMQKLFDELEKINGTNINVNMKF